MLYHAVGVYVLIPRIQGSLANTDTHRPRVLLQGEPVGSTAS